MKSMEITAVGIDVSKRKSTVAIRRPGGVIVACPFRYIEYIDKVKVGNQLF